ncbi:centromere-associated protein E isoform X2 [Gadus morhua]|uniref:centromere-associated protein E isoform X2 n=1 Tax=Gadus morhua TaxID=8049 RepID=UPI0011B62976|nr:centromere-associated protein E-like isoform X2 [Gadus morhua]
MSASAEESAVKVCVRVRPLIEREERATAEDSVPVPLYWKADRKSIHQLDDGVTTKSFSYDRVFSSSETTNHLYQDIAKPLVVSAVEGYNGTIFAYGQTSSGKTFTMMGSKLVPGVIPLSMEEVFQTIQNYPQKEFLLRVSYMEIYNETVTDLLVDSWKRKPLEVREALNKNIYVADLTEELVTCPAQALAWVCKGEKNRHYGKTKMNERSSRSHTIFRMILESREKSDPASGDNSEGAIIVSHLNLVDLAGSERASQTGAEGARFKEGCNINRSLFTLAQVIKKLSDESQRGFTNYRDSKLTRILQNSLGGNAKTVIICTITMAALEETLSTLQFASTAKKMKNDPHVTEVSDDGALLKRYRNEIVDLKRRLQEVSSVTHVTATEKETLSQLLQEKDQLQKEQQDRIKNLTKLLVTGSSLMPAKKIPKRRVTWGGKLVRLSGTTECDVGQSDLSFAEHFSRKRKADSSSMELLEEDEEFDSRWEIPEEYSFTTDTGSVRAHGDSSDFVSPSGSGKKEADLERQLEEERGEREEAQANVASLEGRLEAERGEREEVLAKLSSLEGRLEKERGEKEEVLAKLSSLEEERREKEEVLAKLSSLEEERSGGEEVLSRAASLQQQVELLAREKREAWEEVERLEQRALELEVQRSAQAQEQQEQVQMLELRLADLQEQSHTEAEPDEQMKKEFAETIRMCETLVSEKEMVFAERDYLRQEMELLLGQVSSLEKEKGSLAQELRDFKELEEFKALEDDCSDDEKRVLQNEIVTLKSNVESWERKCRDLESQLGSMSGKLAKKSSWAQELESMQGKDLLQEVSELRRSLDDAEVLGRDNRKEWAVLRSQNLSLKERDVELSSSHQQMVVEVGGLRSQLEKEKSRFKSMQTDLQKELTMAFKENTKLTALLDGKVPSHLLENVHLEGTIASLNEELVARLEAESALREELKTSQEAESALREQLKTAQEAESALREELKMALEAESALREGLNTAQEAESALREELNTAQEAESALREELNIAQEAESALREELKMAQEAESALREEVSCSEQQCSLLEGQLRGLLEEKVALKEEKETLQEEKETLQEEKETLQEEKETLQEEKETLQEEKETLKEEKVALKEEKETLQVEKETLQVEKETLQEEKETLKEEKVALMEEKETLQVEKKTLQEEKETLQVEKETLQEEKETLQVEKETLQEEKETLQEEKETLKEEKETLKEEKVALMEEKETLQEEKETLKAEEETLQEEKKTLKEEKQALQENISHHEPSRSLEEQIQGSVSGPEEVEGVVSAPSQESSPLQSLLAALREEKETLKEGMAALREEKDQLQMDLLENVDMMIENQDELRSALGTINKQKEQIRGLVSLPTANQNAPALDSAHIEDLQNQVKALHAELESVRSERHSQSSDGGREEVDRLVSEVSALSLEREQLQALLEALREEKAQLREEMDDKIQMILLQQQPGIGQQPSLSDELGSLDQYRMDDLQGPLESVTEEKDRLEREVQLSMEKVKALHEELQSVRSERDSQSSVGGQEEVDRLVSEVSALSLEREQLQALLEDLREEMVQLREKLEDKTRMEVEETSSQTEVEVVLRPQEVEETSSQTEVVVQDYEAQLQELKQQIQSLSAELQSVRSERVSQSSIGGLEEVGRLVSEVSALSLEREQLQALLEALREEKAQDKIHMDQVNLEQRADHQEKEDLLAQQIQQLDKQLTEIRMERSELQEELAHMEEEKTGLQEELARMEEEKTGLQEELAHMEEEKTGLQEALARMEEEKTGLLEELARMEEEKTGLQEELAHMEEEKTGLQEALARTEEAKTGLQEALARTEEVKTGLLEALARMEEVKTGPLEALARTEEEKTGLQEELARMEEEKTGLQEELAHMEEEKTGLQEALARMEEEKTGLQEALARMEEEKTGLLEALARTEEAKTGLQEALARTEEEKTGLQEELARMEEEKTGLQEELARMEEEKTGLQEELARMEEEKTGLQEEVGRSLEENRAFKEEVSTITKEKTGLQEELAHMEEEKTGLQEVVTRMEEEKTGLQEKLARMEKEKTGLQEKLAYVEKEKTGLQEVLDRLEEDKTGLQESRNRMEEEEEKTGLREVVTRRAEEDTTRRLKESDESFQLFIGRCCTLSMAPLEQTLVDISVVKDQHLLALPKALVQLYNQILENNSQANQGLRDTMTVLKGHASVFRDVMEELVHGDLGVLEQQRLQDVLLSAPVTPDDDLHAQWERRLPALLDRRERHLQRTSSLLEGLEQSLGSVPRSMAAQLGETGHFLQGLRDACSHAPLDLRAVEDLLTAEAERSSNAAQLSTNTLQVILETQGRVCQELEELKVETTNVLEEERSKTSALLGVDSAALDPGQLELLRDNQKLLLQLHRSQEQLTALRRELEGLEEAQRRSSERLTINKRTTQLLQTELQDACAKIHDKETAINTLRGKLRLSEEAQAQMQAPPSILEREELRGKVLKLEVEVTSVTTKHQKEVKSLSSLLNIKEESLRKLRETLRKSQKEQQESFLQGEDLYCRLTHPEGSKVQTSGSLERSKLEEEIRLLQLKVTELQSLLSSQKAEISSHQAEISKWQSRARTLKEKTKAMRPHLAAPTTPSKRGLLPDDAAAADSAASDSALFCCSPKKFHRALDSPRRGGDSPRRVLEAPVNVPDPNQTYGVDSTEFLRSTLARPKQFFDNSTLGINPGSSSAVEQKEEMWPMSPKKEEMCTSQ